MSLHEQTAYPLSRSWPLYIKELVTPKKQLTWASSNLHCAACTAWPSCLCCEANIPWLQDNLSWFVLREEATGSSHLTPAITPPVWPCLYLKVHHEVLIRMPFLFDRKNDGYSCFLAVRSCTSLSDQNVVTCPVGSICSMLHVYQRSLGCCTTHGSQHLKGHPC